LNFATRTEGNNKQSKIFLDFSNNKPKIRNKANQSLRTKKENKEKQRKYVWSFCVLESGNKNKKNKERKKAKHGYTKYRQNMICRCVNRWRTSPQA
jgi:hypothetical protein